MAIKNITKDMLYPATFTNTEVISKAAGTPATVSLVAGQYTPIGEYTVKADEAIGLGRGAFASMNEAIGRLYAAFYDSETTPGAINVGKLRIMLLSSQDMPIGSKPVFLDVDLAALTSGASIPADRFVLPFDGTLLTQDKKIQFLIKSPTAKTLSRANSTVLMDITRAMQ
jgi:hypothetical protein